jgi:C4-dicarboxylate transporter DctQ subunit
MLKVLDHLEEWLISFLMGAATLIIFAAVMHRYASGVPIPGVQDWVLGLNFSWAQELCIIMFVWMAKFGAAYGVRTGIHVGVDVLINRLNERTRAKFIVFGLLAGAAFTAIVGTLGATFVWRTAPIRRSSSCSASAPATFPKARRRPTSKCRPGWSTRRFRSART